MLSPNQTEKYKQQLNKERARLLVEINSHKKTTDFGSDIDAGDEETDEAEEFGNQLGIIQAFKERLSEIDGALNRIETGEYGLCSKCNRPISEKLLDFIPETALCENCKKSG